jgi:hypothetical protein
MCHFLFAFDLFDHNALELLPYPNGMRSNENYKDHLYNLIEHIIWQWKILAEARFCCAIVDKLLDLLGWKFVKFGYNEYLIEPRNGLSLYAGKIRRELLIFALRKTLARKIHQYVYV